MLSRNAAEQASNKFRSKLCARSSPTLAIGAVLSFILNMFKRFLMN